MQKEKLRNFGTIRKKRLNKSASEPKRAAGAQAARFKKIIANERI